MRRKGERVSVSTALQLKTSRYMVENAEMDVNIQDGRGRTPLFLANNITTRNPRMMAGEGAQACALV